MSVVGILGDGRGVMLAFGVLASVGCTREGVTASAQPLPDAAAPSQQAASPGGTYIPPPFAANWDTWVGDAGVIELDDVATLTYSIGLSPLYVTTEPPPRKVRIVCVTYDILGENRVMAQKNWLHEVLAGERESAAFQSDVELRNQIQPGGQASAQLPRRSYSFDLRLRDGIRWGDVTRKEDLQFDLHSTR